MSIDHDCKSYSLMTLPCSWFQPDRFGSGLPVQQQRYLVDMWNMFLNPVLEVVLDNSQLALKEFDLILHESVGFGATDRRRYGH